MRSSFGGGTRKPQIQSFLEINGKAISDYFSIPTHVERPKSQREGRRALLHKKLRALSRDRTPIKDYNPPKRSSPSTTAPATERDPVVPYSSATNTSQHKDNHEETQKEKEMPQTARELKHYNSHGNLDSNSRRGGVKKEMEFRIRKNQNHKLKAVHKTYAKPNKLKMKQYSAIKKQFKTSEVVDWKEVGNSSKERKDKMNSSRRGITSRALDSAEQDKEVHKEKDKEKEGERDKRKGTRDKEKRRNKSNGELIPFAHTDKLNRSDKFDIRTQEIQVAFPDPPIPIHQ